MASGNKAAMQNDVAARYRSFALALPRAEQGSHMGAEDFRLGGKIFATLAYESKGLGTLKFTSEQQSQVLNDDSDGWFEPAPGGWGRMGMTLVRLDAPDDVLRGALRMAYDTTAAKSVAAKRGAAAKAAARTRSERMK